MNDTPQPMTAEARYAWALAACAARHLRLTHAREHILDYLARHPAPMTWEALVRSPELSICCDPATISRTLALFQEAELVRAIHLPGKSRHYLLNAPGEERAFLICRHCGAWSEFSLEGDALRCVEATAAALGFQWSRHELVAHGVCRACAAIRLKEPPAHKLKVR